MEQQEDTKAARPSIEEAAATRYTGHSILRRIEKRRI